MLKRFKQNEGFSLIELLVVIAIIGILAGAAFTSLNSGAARAKARNLERKSEISLILNAVYQYATDNNGDVSFVPATPTEICKTGVTPATCASESLEELTELTAGAEYLVEIPSDPQEPDTSNGTGYTIKRETTGRITVAAPLAEGETISETR